MKNKLFYVLLFILCIVTIGSVSASDVDMNHDLTNNLCNNTNCDFNCDFESKHSFSDLQSQINSANENDVIEISGIYYYDNTSISVNKSLIIKGLGNGVTFDGCNSSGVFKIYSSKTSFSNMIFTNCNLESTIYWYGDDGVLDNCSFSSNSFGSIYWYGKEGTLSSCYFEVNPTYYVEPINWYGDNPTFSDNSLSNDYGVELAECCSGILHINSTDEIISFRRDSANKATNNIVTSTLGNFYTLKQYRSSNKFVHVIITSDGWLMGSGGRSGRGISYSILNLAKTMVESNSISKNYLNQIKKLLPKYGHFVIKAPNGKFGVVYRSSCFTGTLKEGEFICVPNDITYYRKGCYDNKTDVVTAAIKVLATDKYGVQRRDIITYHCQIVDGKNKVSVYASNDPGKFAGKKSTVKYADNINFLGKFISSSSIPVALSKRKIGTYTFPKQTRAKLSASSIIAYYKSGANLEIKLTSLNGTPLPNKKLTVRLYTNSKKYTDYSVTTNDEGVAKFNTNKLKVGTYSVEVFSPSKAVIASKIKRTIKVSKRPTNVTAPSVVSKYKSNGYFIVKVVDKLNNQTVKNLVIKLKVFTSKNYKIYSIKTDANGTIYFNTKNLSKGTHKVTITSSSSNYAVNFQSIILITSNSISNS